ncbi:hypothetical protein [Bacillus weihaiensis]|uniref:Uncharacterized protein n=1 Tax=Bacillus weihaiensis TaxID=1547283 RepID=A0A1L3MW27_9BACI|nr:hypothetical protein [Bacillus weihaiensis]APH06534.1 hypothetical protein A9C19_18385 [Bacillus weihaiensis]
MRSFLRWSFFVIVALLPLIIFISVEPSNTEIAKTIIEKRFSASSWMVAGVVGFLAFIVLYLTIIFENRIFKSIQGIQEYYHPYALSYSDIQRNLQYYISKSKKGDLIFLYYFYLIAVLSLNVMWCALLKFYAPITLNELILVNQWSFTVYDLSGIIMYGLSISFWLITLLFGAVLCLVINNKNIIGAFKLPKVDDLLDAEYLNEIKAATSEIIIKGNPEINIYQLENEFELYLDSKLPLNNITYQYKIYSATDDLKINIYQKIDKKLNNKNLHDQVLKLEIKSDLTKIVKRMQSQELTYELVVYTNSGLVIGRYVCNLDKSNLRIYIVKKVAFSNQNLESSKIPQLALGTSVEENIDN